MSTIRVAKRKRFTMIARATVNDGRLSFRARGMLTWLLDKPDDWITTADSISAAGTEGRDATRTALRELEATGYLVRHKFRDSHGVWRSEWTVFERPPGSETSAGNPTSDFQSSITDTENETLRQQAKTNADPGCERCQGRGVIWNAVGGFEQPCPCAKNEKANVTSIETHRARAVAAHGSPNADTPSNNRAPKNTEIRQ